MERPKSTPLPSTASFGGVVIEQPRWSPDHLRPPPGYNIQKPLFVLWLAICLAVVVSSLSNADESYVELFHTYYQPLIIMITMLWLWGITVRIFELKAIRYEVCFSSQDQKFLLNSRQIYQASAAITTIVGTSAALFCYHCKNLQTGAASLHPPLMFCLLIAFFLLPIDYVYKDTRQFFSMTFLRVATPWREVTWSDFLLADILTSLSKALSDTERALCHLTAGPVMQPHSTDQVCGNSSWLIPLGLALPYAWRLCQCIRVYRDADARPQLFNALKYSTAFPVIYFSYMKYHTNEAAWVSFYRPLWLVSALVNSAYSYYWDVERDWDIQFFSNRTGERLCWGLRRPLLKTELLYPQGFYYYLMASNLLLRFTWSYKLSPHLRHNYLTVMAFTLAEVFRRFQWLFVRVEVELRKLQFFHPDKPPLVPPPNGPNAKVDLKHILASEDNP